MFKKIPKLILEKIWINWKICILMDIQQILKDNAAVKRESYVNMFQDQLVILLTHDAHL